MNGRNFVQLATLTPGTTQETNPNSFFNGGPSSEVSTRGSFSLSVGGSRASSTDWLLDGNDNNELTAGGIAIHAIDRRHSGIQGSDLQLLGGIRDSCGSDRAVTTKSGSNQFHGSLFEFFRNTSLEYPQLLRCDKGKIQPEPVRRRAGRTDSEGQDVLLRRLSGQTAAEGIPPFVGLVPTPRSAAAISPDFGTSAVTILILQCPERTDTVPVRQRGQPARTPNVGGDQPAGSRLHIYSGKPDHPIAQQMINFYPTAREQRRSSTTTPTFRSESWTKASSTSAWTTISPLKDSAFARFSYDQATLSYLAGARLRRAMLRQHTEHQQPWAQRGGLRDPHLL